MAAATVSGVVVGVVSFAFWVWCVDKLSWISRFEMSSGPSVFYEVAGSVSHYVLKLESTFDYDFSF